MEKESNAVSEARSNKWIWILLAVVILCVALLSCIVLFGAGAYLLPVQSRVSTALPDVPNAQTVPASTTTIPAETPRAATGPVLDFEADPLFGSASLQRGFTPDPYRAEIRAGGPADTSAMGLDCGFTSSAPSFSFRLTGGASETFLRIFFSPSDGTDTTLVVLTPNQKWLCANQATNGNGTAPVIDMEFAASGQYAVWAGTHQRDRSVSGSLFITQSMETTP